ncbi:MAG: hypothetical protein CL910_16120 [Deltaproteobacteria bacterium]|jgi:hypothetical protein|nr:hypothetical protein [Deltaproteobacteria bacterium]
MATQAIPAAADERALIQNAVVRMRARIMAVVFGMVGGVGVSTATAWLLVKGGKQVGKHLNLLGNYFPGYDVSWTGVFLGFFYGALVGALIGFCVAWVYNRVADSRHP